MLYKTLNAAVCGIDASVVEVEVDISGIETNLLLRAAKHFHVVGLLDAGCAKAGTGCGRREWGRGPSTPHSRAEARECSAQM